MVFVVFFFYWRTLFSGVVQQPFEVGGGHQVWVFRRLASCERGVPEDMP